MNFIFYLIFSAKLDTFSDHKIIIMKSIHFINNRIKAIQRIFALDKLVE